MENFMYNFIYFIKSTSSAFALIFFVKKNVFVLVSIEKVKT